MSSTGLATVVIACPHCGTRYQVPSGTLGPDGREVQCAQCTKSWHARPVQPSEPRPAPKDPIFSADDERALDEAFEAEQRKTPQRTLLDPEHEKTLAEIRAAIAPRVPAPNAIAHDPAELKSSHVAFEQRLEAIRSSLPMARVRRSARMIALGAVIVLIAALLLFRVDLVRTFPSLAGAYAAFGLPVNVVGLQFENANTLMTIRNGVQVMKVTASIRSVASGTVKVPPVLVTLLDSNSIAVYEWTVVSALPEMQPGEVADFSTEVNAPPEGAVRVRLSFTSTTDKRAVKGL